MINTGFVWLLVIVAASIFLMYKSTKASFVVVWFTADDERKTIETMLDRLGLDGAEEFIRFYKSHGENLVHILVRAAASSEDELRDYVLGCFEEIEKRSKKKKEEKVT